MSAKKTSGRLLTHFICCQWALGVRLRRSILTLLGSACLGSAQTGDFSSDRIEDYSHARDTAGFHHLYDGGAIYEVACWAHARRKFHEIHIAHPSPTTSEAIKRIAALYAIEAEIRGSRAEIRKATRQARARPLLDGMHTWLEATLAKLSTKSDTAAAIRYALSRWRALTRYVDDGKLEIDNNAAERALRVVALGRKNFLFAGSDSGGERAAAIYSLLGTAKLNGLDPEIYLHHVLERIADHPISRISQMLPWNLSGTTQTTPS